MKLISFIVLLTVCISCTQSTKQPTPASQSLADSLAADVVNSLTVDLLIDIQPTHTLPFGEKQLITNYFPPSWRFQYWEADSIDTPLPSICRVYDSAYNTLMRYTNPDMYPDLYFNKKLSTLKNIYPERLSTPLYYDKIIHAFDNETPKGEFLSPVAYLRVNDSIDLLVFAIQDITLETDRYRSEYSDYRYSRMELALVKNKRIEDWLNVYYTLGWSIFTDTKLFYIDEKGIVSVKYFAADEGYFEYIRSEKFQILPQGRFARYYDKDGEIENAEEWGTVANGKRVGEWIEMKNTHYHPMWDRGVNKSYLEASYEDGIPVGTWKYYALEQDMDSNEQPVPDTSRKGGLGYTETYRQGRLLKREYVKK